jgi:hypothetical protein
LYGCLQFGAWGETRNTFGLHLHFAAVARISNAASLSLGHAETAEARKRNSIAAYKARLNSREHGVQRA